MGKSIYTKLFGIVANVYLNGEEKMTPLKQERLDHVGRVFRIVKDLAIEFDEVDMETLCMGAIMHDVAKFIDSEKHHTLGYVLTNFLLDGLIDDEIRMKVAKLVLLHSDREVETESLSNEEIILMDADIIDKVSVTRAAHIISNPNTNVHEKWVARDKMLAKAYKSAESLRSEAGKKMYNEHLEHTLELFKMFNSQFNVK